MFSNNHFHGQQERLDFTLLITIEQPCLTSIHLPAFLFQMNILPIEVVKI